MKNILNRGFSKLSDSAFVGKVQLILGQLAGNPNFVTTSPTLAVVSAALTSLTDAMAIAVPHARELAVIAARRALEQLLDDLADNLEQTANDDPVKLATTGYDMHRTPEQTSEAPPIPQNVRLKQAGISGAAHLMFDASDRAKGYQVQTAPDPVAGPWTDYDIFSSSRGALLKGFPHATDLWVRVRALGPNNTKSGWSDPATILIN